MQAHLEVFPLTRDSLLDNRSLSFRDDYTAARATSASKVVQHNGTDIFVPNGTLVLAAVGGIVSASRWSGLGGWSVLVSSKSAQGTQYATLYAHFDIPPFVCSGDRVLAGTLLGVSGQTGGVDGAPVGAQYPRGPHLHFAMSREGVYVNSYPQLDSMAQLVAARSSGYSAWGRVRQSVMSGRLSSNFAVSHVAAAVRGFTLNT